MSHTTFQLYDRTEKDSSSHDIINEPVLVSFPNNIPTQEALSKMKFNILQQNGNTGGKGNKKRVIKAQQKGVRYVAKSNTHDVLPKEQASDYYMGVFNTQKNKVFMIPLKTPYQFTQEIENFQEIFGQEDDNEAFKAMSYMDHKLHLVNAFGTKKAKQKVNSMLTNMVNEGGDEAAGGASKKKGTKDQRLTEKAEHIDTLQKRLKEEIKSSSSRRENVYSKAQLLPDDIIKEVPFKETYNALKSNNQQTLGQLIRNSQVRSMIQNTYNKFNKGINSDKDKKVALRGHIYLDCLITFFRMKPHIEDTPEEISKKLNMPSIQVVEYLLEEFSQISAKNQAKMDSQQDESEQGNGASEQGFKYIKSKQLTKKLMCHILGIAVLLMRGEPLKGSIMAQILKKEVGELKSYFQELGLHVEVQKVKGSNDDLIVTGAVAKEKTKDDSKSKKKPKTKDEEKEEIEAKLGF